MKPHRESFDLKGIAHSVPIPMGARVGNMLFSSGIMGMDPQTGKLGEGIAQQTELAFSNMAALVEAAGGTVGDIGHMRVLLQDDAARAEINKAWLEYFPDRHSRPARHTVLGPLRGGMLVQLEIIAVLR